MQDGIDYQATPGSGGLPLNPEYDFLCRVVGCALGHGELPGHLRTSEGVNPSRLVSLALQHRCLPLLARGLEQGHREGRASWMTLDPEQQALLSRAHGAGTARAVVLARRMVWLAGILRAEGIRVLALKGPALARFLYGHVDCRPFDDLDLWVHPADFSRACGCLESLEFHPLLRLSPDEARSHRRAGWDRGYRSPEGDYLVELCTGIAPRYFVCPPDAEALWSGSIPLVMEGGTVNVPGPEALLELLCLHGLKHGWSRLLWVADVAAMAGRREGLDWRAVEQNARRHGTLWAIGLGLRLADTHVGARHRWPVPPPLVERMAALSLAGIEPCSGSQRETRLHLAARERWRDRIRYVALSVFTPGFSDWQWVRLPRRWFGLYWVLRPLRLIMGCVTRMKGMSWKSL
jgi:hypothetical protein